MNSLVIIGRRWNDVHGNTYHTADIIADGIPVGDSSEIHYGYGDHYLQTAAEQLGFDMPITRYCRDNDIALTYRATDVNRKKDL